jgi:hypothetical protein
VYQAIKYNARFIVTASIVFICFLQASEQSNKPIYLELGPCAECNYCHIVKDNLFSIFIALTEIQRQRTFNQNRFFCNKQPFKPEVFNFIRETKTNPVRNEKDITDTINDISKVKKAYGYLINGYQININNSDELLKANNLIKKFKNKL